MTFDERLELFIKHANELSAKYWKDMNYTFSLPPTYVAQQGPKWVKVFKVENEHNGTSRQTSIYAFIVKESFQNKTLGSVTAGDVHKPATYNSPAKTARGNIFVDGFNNCAGPHGIAYLR